MTAARLLLLAPLLLLAACAGGGASDGGRENPMRADAEFAGWLEVRAEVPQGTPGAIWGRDHNEVLWFGEPAWFPLSEVAVGADEMGLPSVAFTVAEGQAGTFSDYSERHRGERVGIFVDGELLTAPTVQDRLPGSGVISGGADGWSEQRCAQIVAGMQAARPPAQGAAMEMGAFDVDGWDNADDQDGDDD